MSAVRSPGTRDTEIPQSVIDDANADIVGVVSRYMTIKKTGKNYSGCCPFHKEKSPSFTVSNTKGFYYCFGCGAGGDAVKFVMDFDGISFREAVERIVGNLPADISERAKLIKATAVRESYPPSHVENRERAADHLEQAVPVETHIELLRENTAAIGALSLNGRLIVPLLNGADELVNVAALVNGNVYYCAKGISFGATARIPARINSNGQVILCCDYFAAWRLWWALKGVAEIRAAISPDNFVWMTRKAKQQFNCVAVPAEDMEEMRELGFEVVEIVPAYR